jgi:hypothetical protein
VLVTHLFDESRPRLQSRGEPNSITPTRLPKGSFVVKGAIHSSLAVRLQRERRERTVFRYKLHWADRDGGSRSLDPRLVISSLAAASVTDLQLGECVMLRDRCFYVRSVSPMGVTDQRFSARKHFLICDGSRA